jgi:ribosomal protein S27E
MKKTVCEDCGADIVVFIKPWQHALCYACQQKRILEEKERKRLMEKTYKATGCYFGGLDKWI